VDRYDFRLNFDRLLIPRIPPLTEKFFWSTAIDNILRSDFILQLLNIKFIG